MSSTTQTILPPKPDFGGYVADPPPPRPYGLLALGVVLGAYALVVYALGLLP